MKQIAKEEIELVNKKYYIQGIQIKHNNSGAERENHKGSSIELLENEIQLVDLEINKDADHIVIGEENQLVKSNYT